MIEELNLHMMKTSFGLNFSTLRRIRFRDSNAIALCRYEARSRRPLVYRKIEACIDRGV